MRGLTCFEFDAEKSDAKRVLHALRASTVTGQFG